MAVWTDRRLIAGRGSFGWPVATIDPETGKGEPLHTMAYGATVAEIEVGPGDGRGQSDQAGQRYDCGKAINPRWSKVRSTAARQAVLGAALLEELHPYYPTLEHYPTGFFSYMMPTAKDVPSWNRSLWR